MTLIHYSHAKFLTEVYSVKQEKEGSLKPEGLWFSVQDKNDWAEWCQAEHYPLGPYMTEITLNPAAKILHLSSAKHIDRFTSKFSFIPASLANGHDNFVIRSLYINWNRVAAAYHGIIIAPYCYSRRLGKNTLWYYGWDCASGCIWNSAAVKCLNPHETVCR